jgi:hypothetical protein
MDFKFEIDDEASETEVGSVSYLNDTVDLLVSPTDLFDRVDLSIGHKRVFDENGFEDAHVLTSINITFGKSGQNIKPVSVTRENFYLSFSAKGILCDYLLMESTLPGRNKEEIRKFVDSLRQFICDYCEQNDISIFDK